MSRRLALLIATYEYDPGSGLSKLASPAHDAQVLAAVLADPDIGGFEVRPPLINLPHHLVGEALGEFYLGCRADDLALVYVTGHGLKDDNGDLYFAMTDTRPDNLLFTALSADAVNRAMEGSRSRQKVLVLDCCYAGAFPPGRVAKAGAEVHALERFRGRGRAVLTASDSTQYAFEGNTLTGQAEPSVFTGHFVAGLRTGDADRDGDGDITLDELYDYVHDKVTAEVSGQRPRKQADVEGAILIGRNAHWTLPWPLREAIASAVAPHRLSALDGLAHLYRIGNDRVRAAVLAEIERLADDDSRSVSSAATALLQSGPPSHPSHPAEPAPRARDVPLELPLEVAHLSVRGQWLATAGEPADQVRLWDLDSRLLRRVLPHDHPVRSLKFSPADDLLATAVKTEGEKLWLWDAASGELRQTHNAGLLIQSFGFSPGGRWLVATARESGRMWLWDVPSGELRHTLAHGKPIRQAQFSADGRRIAATGQDDDTLHVWDVASGRLRLTFTPEQQLFGWGDTPTKEQCIDWWTFSPNGCWMTIRVKNLDPQLWDAAHGLRTADFFRDHPVTWPVFSPDGRWLVTRDLRAKDARAWLWDVATGRHVHTLDGTGLFWDIEFGPGNDLLATGSHGEEAVIWNLATGEPVRTLRYKNKKVERLAFSPDGSTLAARCDVEGSVPLWDFATGRLRHSLPCGLEYMKGIFRFSPDGNLLSTRSEGEEQVRVWDVATGQIRDTFPHGGLQSSNFSPDGRWLITRGKNTSIIWEL